MTEWTTQSMQNALLSLNGTEKALGERISSEIKFAEDFARLKGKEGAWKKLVREACRIIGEAAQSGLHLTKAVEEAEAVLAPIGKAAKQYTVHCVGHAHIDMNWMWSWPETVSTTNDTFITVLRLMDEYPDFHFSQSQVSVYEIMREYNPEVFEQIKKRVAEGRWEINAAHWVEGDKNIASGESLARHLLYSRAFMKEHFNLDPEDISLDWEPDTFGHAHTIPTLDARGAVKRYYFFRSGHTDVPPVFWWEGPDGSRVLAYWDVTSYNGKVGSHVIDPMIQFCEKTGLKDYMWVYGIGDHGGGPTRRDIRMCHEMNSWPIYPTFRLAPARDFYDAAEADGARLPVINSEINFAFMGCYTSQSLIKKTNRLGECMMERADWAAALAWRTIGKAYPSAPIQQGWINTIFGHFHDILPGSGIAATREYHSGQFQKTAATSSMIQTNSLRALAAKIDFSYAGASERKALTPNQETDAAGGGAGRGTHFGALSTAGHADSAVRPFAVFNPTAWDRTDVVPLTVWDAEAGGIHNRNFVIRTPDGKRIPAQRVGKGDYWGHPFVDILAPVSVRALGYSSFVVEEDSGAPTAALESTVKVTGSGWARSGEYIPMQAGMENEFLAVNIDSSTGGDYPASRQKNRMECGKSGRPDIAA